MHKFLLQFFTLHNTFFVGWFYMALKFSFLLVHSNTRLVAYNWSSFTPQRTFGDAWRHFRFIVT